MCTKRAYDTFIDMMSAEVTKFKVGHPLDAGATFGPINNKGQFNFISALLERNASGESRRHRTGGKTRAGAMGEG